MSMRGNDRIEKHRQQKDNTRQNSQSESVRETTIRVPCNLTFVFSSFVWGRELGVDYLFLLHANVDQFRTGWFVKGIFICWSLWF
jgi:hypothetical protein